MRGFGGDNYSNDEAEGTDDNEELRMMMIPRIMTVRLPICKRHEEYAMQETMN